MTSRGFLNLVSTFACWFVSFSALADYSAKVPNNVPPWLAQATTGDLAVQPRRARAENPQVLGLHLPEVSLEGATYARRLPPHLALGARGSARCHATAS